MRLSFFVWLGLIGAAGTWCRYFLMEWSKPRIGLSFPWDLWVVNILGAFLFGLFITLSEEKHWISKETKLLLTTGFLGAFTTFSTFAYQNWEMIEKGRWIAALANILGQNTLGILAVALGIQLARRWF